MTMEELRDRVNKHCVIVCSTPQERNDTLRYLKSIGFCLGSAAEAHAVDNDTCGEFRHPRFNGKAVCCHNDRVLDHDGVPKVPFFEIQHLVYGIPEEPEQTKEEFDRAFAELIGGVV